MVLESYGVRLFKNKFKEYKIMRAGNTNILGKLNGNDYENIDQNILLNAFRIAINGSLVKFNMVDGIMDEFEDESGVDTGTSTNELYDSGGDYYEPTGATDNMTLVSNATEAEEQPDESRLVIMEEDVDVITLNTDLKAYVSRDNGGNWVQATLSDEGDYASSKRILVGTADISGQAADKTIKWKIESLNNKDLKIHGIGLLWR